MDRLSFWLACKSLYLDRQFDLSRKISFVSLVLGVASLVTAMAVVSGFFTALQKSIVDVTGDVLVLSRSTPVMTWTKLLDKAKETNKDVVEGSPFLFVEGLLAHKGKLSGVAVQGVDPSSVHKVLGLKNRLIEGCFDLEIKDTKDVKPLHESSQTLIPALLGKKLAEKIGVNVGETFFIVFPVASGTDSGELKKEIGKFQLKGILSLGKYDYDSRYVITSLEALQNLAKIKLKRDYTGLYVKLTSSSLAQEVALDMNQKMPYPYWVRDWQSVEQNLFEAINLEKAVIFVVVFVMILAAALNVACSLYIHVIKKYAEISILKSMGLSSNQVLCIFSWQGIVIGFVGSLCGLVLGLFFCWCFHFLVSQTGLLPQDVYRLSEFSPVIKFTDVIVIFCMTTLTCFLATLAPAFRGARLKPVEGLRYE